MFDRHNEEQHNLYITIQNPKGMADMKTLTFWDSMTAGHIRDAEAVIETLKKYRAMLAERAQELLTMDYTRILKIKRERNYYSNHVFYYVQIIRRLADGSEQDELCEKYEGTERHKAFKRFAELQKQNPGIETVQDTAKGKWER